MRRQRSSTWTQQRVGLPHRNRRRSKGRKMAGFPLASTPTEARKFFHDDEMRFGTPGRDAMRRKAPPLSKATGTITIAVVNRSADVAWDHRRLRGTTWHHDEGDRCSREQRCRPDQRAGVGARATERQYPQSAPDGLRAPAGSPGGAGMVPKNRRGEPHKALLILQEIVA
jgi:hypothetical protein